jgi:transcriptional regulator with XRE-family HTH domain
MEHRPKRPSETGPAGRRAAANIERLREDRGLSQEELAEAAERLGRPMSRQMVGKTEQLDRRIDADDLMAFAVVLDTTPNRLLLPGSASDDQVELLPALIVTELEAWKWASGEEPLPPDLAPAGRRALDAPEERLATGGRISAFLRENRPQATPDGHFGRMFVHGDLVDAVVSAARLAREHGVPLAEVKHFLEFIYTVTLADHAPGGDEG